MEGGISGRTGVYIEAPPERGTFSMLKVYPRPGISFI